MPYITEADVRAEGVPATITPAQITASITYWQQMIERLCRQFFEARQGTLDVDGNDSGTLFLSIPIVQVTALYLNNCFTTPIAPSAYKVYNRIPPLAIEDDRRNPKIKLVDAGGFRNMVFHNSTVFESGQLNQRIVGTFGFVEADQSTPEPIKRAMKKLVIRDVSSQGTGKLHGAVNAPPVPAGPITMEMADGHQVMYSDSSPRLARRDLEVITGDAEVAAILTAYRAPIAIAVPGSQNWRLG